MSSSDVWTVVAVIVGVLLTSTVGLVGWLCASAFNNLAATVQNMHLHVEKLRIDAATVDIRLTAVESDVIELRHRIDQLKP